jgi:polyhydroxyalkanoate synthesis regulator phasin
MSKPFVSEFRNALDDLIAQMKTYIEDAIAHRSTQRLNTHQERIEKLERRLAQLEKTHDPRQRRR